MRKIKPVFGIGLSALIIAATIIKPAHLQADVFKSINNSLFSTESAFVFSFGWAYTMADQFYGGNDYYNYGDYTEGGEKMRWWAEHLHVGYGLYMAGNIIKNNYPDFYRKLPNGIKFLSYAGIFIQFDDMYQHLIMHKNPAQHGTPKSPIHQLYVAAERPDNTGGLKMMFNMLRIRRMTLSAGYFQGPAAELSFNAANLWNNRVGFEVDNIVGVCWDAETQLRIEQFVIGVSLHLHISSWLNLKAGFGNRLYSSNPFLKPGPVLYYGIHF